MMLQNIMISDSVTELIGFLYDHRTLKVMKSKEEVSHLQKKKKKKKKSADLIFSTMIEFILSLHLYINVHVDLFLFFYYSLL
jgi:hypothetical protein